MTEPRETAISFDCHSDILVGILHRTASPTPQLGVLLVVGGPQYRVGSHRQFVLMARDLAKAGFPVLRFDYRGMGDSDGAQRSFDDVRDDIHAATDALVVAEPSLRSVVLWGLCDAASAVAMQGFEDARVAGLVMVNPWVRTPQGEARAYVRHYYRQRLLQRSFWTKLLTGQMRLIAALRDWLNTRRLAAEDNAGGGTVQPSFIARMHAGLVKCQGSVLCLLSSDDLTAKEFDDLVHTDQAWATVVERPAWRFERLAGADHTFSKRLHLDSATAICCNWLHQLEP